MLVYLPISSLVDLEIIRFFMDLSLVCLIMTRKRKKAEEARRQAEKEDTDRLMRIKVHSCMTLFDAVSPDDIFQEVRDEIYG